MTLKSNTITIPLPVDILNPSIFERSISNFSNIYLRFPQKIESLHSIIEINYKFANYVVFIVYLLYFTANVKILKAKIC